MNCIKCGVKIENKNMNFCGNCGHSTIYNQNENNTSSNFSTEIDNGEFVKRKKNFTIIVVFILICSLVLYLASESTNEVESNSSTNNEKIAVKQAVINILKDPSSATFGEININDDLHVACVLVNAKNGFGGYTGEHGIYVSKIHGIWEACGSCDCL